MTIYLKKNPNTVHVIAWSWVRRFSYQIKPWIVKKLYFFVQIITISFNLTAIVLLHISLLDYG